MFTKLANYMSKVISYPSNLLAAISMVGMVFVMLVVVGDVLGRRFFDAPIRGASDLQILSFCIIVWGPMAMAAAKGSHVALTSVVDKIPRLPRLYLDLIIGLVSGAIFGMVCWRLVMYGINIGKRLEETGILDIPLEPFVYLAGAACGVMALVFLAKVPEAVGKIRKEQ